MSGPPADIPASELWLKLAQKERPSKVVDFPRKGEDGNPIGQLRIRILTQEEQMASASAAEKLVREHLKEAKKDDLGYERLFSDAYCVEVLFRACRDVDNEQRSMFPSPKHIRQALTTEECAMLFQHYLTVSVELGPIVVNMTDAEYESWIDRLVEGGSAFPFDLLSSDLQRILILYTASQLRSLQTGKSFAGLQQEDEPQTSE